MRSTLRLWIAVAAVSSLAGCPKDSTGKPHTEHDGGAGDASEDGGVSGYCPPETPMFALERDTPGKKGVIGRVFDANPSPPARYNNAWTLDFVDADGKPIEDLEIVKAESRMPYHTHPPRPASNIVKQSEPGRFKLTVYLQMPGYFEVHVNVKSASLGSDEVVFPYCLE